MPARQARAGDDVSTVENYAAPYDPLLQWATETAAHSPFRCGGHAPDHLFTPLTMRVNQRSPT